MTLTTGLVFLPRLVWLTGEHHFPGYGGHMFQAGPICEIKSVCSRSRGSLEELRLAGSCRLEALSSHPTNTCRQLAWGRSQAEAGRAESGPPRKIGLWVLSVSNDWLRTSRGKPSFTMDRKTSAKTGTKEPERQNSLYLGYHPSVLAWQTPTQRSKPHQRIYSFPSWPRQNWSWFPHAPW